MILTTQRITNIIGWFLFAGVLALYLLTLEPVASFWDSGEYIASSYKLEIPHPPGGPLFLLLGRLFSFFAFGDQMAVAKAVNSLSAVSSALTVLFLFWTIVRLSDKLLRNQESKTISWVAGLVGALSFAFTDTFWYSATETELYGIATFFIAFVFWAIFKWEEEYDKGNGNRWLILIAYVIGLSVGIHLLSLLAIPSLGLVYYFKRYQKSSKKGILIALICAGGMLFFVLYGLVTLANFSKYAEIFLVNNVGLPFGSGVILIGVLVVTSLIYGLRFSVKNNKINLNTVLLGLSFILIGYMSYGVVLVRANFGPPINQNDPGNVLSLIYYLNMEQYPSRPLLYGKYFNAPLKGYKQGKPVYEMKDGKYVIKDYNVVHEYPEEYYTIFPRAYSDLKPGDEAGYRSIMGLSKNEKPTFSDNLFYLFEHQTGHMYLRYFMWNFSGRAGSKDGAGWLSPVSEFKSVPEVIRNDKARNNYWMMPLFLGILGMVFMYRCNKKLFFVNAMLFFMTGFALVLYLNSPPSEPRERDYIYVGSYYAFAVWIGVGTMGILNFMGNLIPQRKLKLSVAIMSLVSFSVPALLLVENYDDHDRSERYFSVLQARNTLASCEENAILFTGGDNDTYPLWYVQEVEGFRTDVRVVVLSYANVDWYINPLFDQKNLSAGLPHSLSKSSYKQGGLVDYAPVYEKEELRKRPIATRKYLELINKKYKGLIHQTPLGEMAIIPARNVQSNMDTSKMGNREDIPDIARDKLSDEFDFIVKGSGLEKKDMLIMDIVDSNKWERPVYFNYTSLNQVNFDFERKTVQVGDIYRLLPISTSLDLENPLIDTAKMYRNLIERSSYQNMNKKGIHYHGNYIGFAQNQRNNFNKLISTLIDEGSYDTARKVLNTSLSLIPDEVIPISVTGIDYVESALLLKEMDTANYLADRMCERAKDWLEHAEYDEVLWNDRETQLNLYLMSQFTRMFHRAGELERAKKYNDLLEKYYRS